MRRRVVRRLAAAVGRRILIIGCGGSGKSTLSVALGERLALPVVHLDRLFWRAGWVQISRDAFDSALQLELAKPAWVMDGNYDRTLPLRLRACDTVVYLDYPPLVCLWGVLCRQLRYRGRTRPDMADGCPERVDRDFLRWILTFRAKHGKAYAALLRTAEANGVAVIIHKSRRACAKWLAGVGTGTVGRRR